MGDLRQYMSTDEDRLHFEEHMHVPNHATGSVADAFHLRMQDRDGTKLDVELFHVCFLSMLEVSGAPHPRHLVGIREHSEAWPAPEPVHRASLFDALDDLMRDVSVHINIDMQTMDICWCSHSFVELFGNSKSCFLDWVMGDITVFQFAFNTIAHGADGDGNPREDTSTIVDIGVMRLRIPVSKTRESGSIDVRANVTMALGPSDSPSGEHIEVCKEGDAASPPSEKPRTAIRGIRLDLSKLEARSQTVRKKVARSSTSRGRTEIYHSSSSASSASSGTGSTGSGSYLCSALCVHPEVVGTVQL